MLLVINIQHRENQMGKYFGTDGFRGVANVNLPAMHAFRVGRFTEICKGQQT